MCGIAGFVNAVGRDAARINRPAVLDSMCKVITHRGPDEQGTRIARNAALGMRRLSIIDLVGGQQPIAACDDRLFVVFNGEIYNYRILREELESLGHRFKTKSDTEVIVHAYEEYGVECVQRLRGMFVFAIWDDDSERLFVARDRAGKKPLYYTTTRDGDFVFGSELKSLLQHPSVDRSVDFTAMDAYLTLGYVPDPLSIFEGVKKLPPGSLLILERGVVRTEQYWDFKYGRSDAAMTESDAVERLRELIDEAVKVRLVSEVPLGAFLSGGVDSSTVVGLMARHMDQPVKTFSIGFNEDSFNELKYARQAASHYGTDHHEFIVTPEICSVVDELVWHLDEPFADSSAIPTYIVSKMARDFVTVVLSGDGGDELFAGYTRYAVDRSRSAFDKVPRFVRQGILSPVSAALPHGAFGRNYLHNISLDAVARYADSVSLFTALGRRSLYAPAMSEKLDSDGGVLSMFSEFASAAGTDDDLERLLYIDSKSYLPGDILTKVDRMSMAASLETRTPLLDQDLIDFVMTIPAEFKMRDLETKYIFRKAVRDLVPDEILDRPKQGFGVPMQQWINSELKKRIREVVLDPGTLSRGYFNRSHVELLFNEHGRGRRDHSMQLWALFMLEMWHRAFVGNLPKRQIPAEVDYQEHAAV